MRQLLLALLIAGLPIHASAWILVDAIDNPPSLELPILCCNHRCVPGQGAGCPETGFGSVGYAFEIQEANVTVAEYLAFLNAVAASDPQVLWGRWMKPQIVRSGLHPSYSYALAAPGLGQRPAVFVDLFDAFRYANWMHNGQPVGPQDAASTEDGAYTLLGQNPPWVQRNAGASYFVANEDEWYKAAYYDPASQTYSRFSWGEALPRGLPPGFATRPEDTNLCAPPVPQNWNCECPITEGLGVATDVCAYPGRSAYGLCDTTGNLFEILETREVSSGGVGAPPRGTVLAVIRGGSFGNPGFCDAAADGRNFTNADTSCAWCGVRLARQPQLSVPAPEPSSRALGLAMLAALAGLRSLSGPRPG
ncbi:MAG: SUMF1/EgtB/PvdO family nonheme iron enzyme [Myxococcota bacterium]